MKNSSTIKNMFLVKNSSGLYCKGMDIYECMYVDYNDALKQALNNAVEEVTFIDDNYTMFNINVSTGITEHLGEVKIVQGLDQSGYYNKLLNFTLLVD